jgi:type IV fimbrial biogenesis protein FimT
MLNPRAMLTRARRRGFTLIELIVVLVVLALAMAVAAPTISATIENAKLRSHADALQAGIQMARMEAMKRNTNVRFTLVSQNSSYQLDGTCAASTAGGSWVVSVDSPIGACGADAGGTAAPRLVGKRAGGQAGSTFTVTTNTGATQAIFTSLGTMATGSALRNITIASTSGVIGARTLRIEMTAGGVLRLCEPAAAATDVRRCLHS